MLRPYSNFLLKVTLQIDSKSNGKFQLALYLCI